MEAHIFPTSLPDDVPNPSDAIILTRNWLLLWRRLGMGAGCVLAMAVGQFITLTQSQIILITADTPSYLNVAHAIMDHHFFFDATRTPGYPALLAIVFSIAGRDNMTAVMGVQAALLVLAMGEIVMIMHYLFPRPLLVTLVTCLIALNPYLLNWERSITTEAFSLWQVVTCFMCFALFAHTRRWSWLAALAVMSALAVLTRPFFIFLPALLFGMLLVWLWLIAAPRRQIASALVAGLGCLAAILAFMAGNAITCGYFGLSDVGSINLFGKVLEYHMENESTGTTQVGLRQDLRAYLRTARDPWGFPYHNPRDATNHYGPIAAFSHDIILHHLPEFAWKTMPDIVMALNANPFPYVPYISPLPQVVVTLLNIGYIELGLTILLPLLLALNMWDFWRDPASLERLLALTLALGMAGAVIMAAVGSYTTTANGLVSGDFYRLRAPMDWAMIALLVHAIARLGHRCATRENPQDVVNIAADSE